MNQKHRELALHALAAAMGTASLALGCYTVLAILYAVNTRDAKDAITALLLALGCIASAMTADDAEKEIHDIYKLDLYQTGSKNVKNPETGKWETVPCYIHSDGRLLGHGEESVIMAMRFIPNMPPRVALAIRWHMGAYKDPDKISQMSKAFDNCPEALAVHLADMMAAHDTEADA